MKRQHTVSSLEETRRLAETFAQYVQPHMVITLEGDLGAGKTTFTQFLADALEIEEVVNSPTFTIMKSYHSGVLPLHHIDAYRLEGSQEDLGWDEIFTDAALVIVEWAQFIEEELPEQRLQLSIRYVDETTRMIECVPIGERYETLCQEVFE